MNSRHLGMAESEKLPDVYEDALSHLHYTKTIFEKLSVAGEGWKHIQTAMIMVTTPLLEFQEILLSHDSYDYVLLSQFIQDSLETAFPLVHLKNPPLLPMQVKYALWSISISQFLKETKNSN